MERKRRKNQSINTLPLYIAFVALFILFITYQGNRLLSAIFGIALFMVITIIIALELLSGVHEQGLARNAIEIAAAVIVVLVVWLALRYLLHTSYPLDVVPSCSMLPNLKRGDLILLQGVENISKIKAPVMPITASQESQLKSGIQDEFLSCVAYRVSGSTATVTQMINPGDSVGLYSAQRNAIVPNSVQSGLPIQYTCGARSVMFSNGSTGSIAYTTSVTVNGNTIYSDANNTIVVYATIPSDYFYKLGDSYIVHRAYAILDYNGSYTVLTKGDNNPGLDIQYGNYPLNLSTLQGRVIAAVPYLGYLKLALSSSFVEPAGCNSTIVQQ